MKLLTAKTLPCASSSTITCTMLMVWWISFFCLMAARQSSAFSSHQKLQLQLLSPCNRNRCYQTHVKMSKDNNSAKEEEFKLGKPIDLPSLREPKDAGPMFATCRSVTGVEPAPVMEDNPTATPEVETASEATSEAESFIPNKPIELESLKNAQQRPTFLGLEPKDDDLRRRDGSLNVAESGLPLFTSTIIFGMTWYLIYIALFTDMV